MYKELKSQIAEAMKARDSQRLGTLRLLQSECTNYLVAQKKKPTDDVSDNEFITIIQKMIKQREDAAMQYENAGRAESAAAEKEEAGILEGFLPEQLTQEEVEAIVEKHSKDLDLNDKSAIGKLMKAVMEEVGAKAQGKVVSEIVKKKFVS